MSRGYWLVLLGVGGFSALAGALVVAAWVYASPGAKPQIPKVPAAAHAVNFGADAVGCAPEELKAVPRGARAPRAYACAQYEEQRQLSEDNIAQAARAASVAAQQLDLSYRQTRSGHVQAVATVAALAAAIAAAIAGTWAAFFTRQQARVAERALFDLERPIVFGFVERPEPISVKGPFPRPDTANVNISNFGKSPAFLRRIEYRISAVEKGGAIDPIDPGEVGGRELPEGTVSVNGDPHVEGNSIRLQFFPDAEAIESDGKSVWVTGFIRYDDVFGRHHISGFTLVYDPLGNRYIRRGGATRNYHRIERDEDIPPPSSKG